MTQQLLMIEDDARLANMVGEYLERQSGYGFTHAADGASGLAALEGGHARPRHPGPDAARHGRPGSVPAHQGPGQRNRQHRRC
jgi:CheY-like chemotaxis protein